MTGHFTQVVWKASTQLGIGYSRSSDRTKVYVVGRYMAPGNYAGRFKENVIVPNYLLTSTYDDNCLGIDGGLTDWSPPGECSRSCGGGIRFKTKSCTDP
ncbi:CAP domain-containing protein, partial [Salmonella sp. s54412]